MSVMETHALCGKWKHDEKHKNILYNKCINVFSYERMLGTTV